MHRFLSLVCLGSGLLIGLAPAADKPASGKKYAFLVACSKYEASEFRKLEGTVAEMKDFRKALLDSGFAEENIVFLHDGADKQHRPNKENILRELAALVKRVKSGDLLVAAFDGHGAQYSGDDNQGAYFAPLDADPEEPSTLVPIERPGGVYQQLKNCKQGRRLLLVNTCRDDPRRSSAKLKDKIDDGLLQPQGIAVMFSCQPGQKSWEYPPDTGPKDTPGRSLFYHQVIETWRGQYLKDEDKGKPITLEHLFAEVPKRTEAAALAIFKDKNKEQKPHVRREYDGKWVLREGVPSPTLAFVDEFKRRGAITGTDVLLPGVRPPKVQSRGISMQTFRFEKCDDELLAGLPVPTVAFGLDLQNTKVTDAGLKHLGRFTRMRALNLKFNSRVTDAGLKHLAGLTQLCSLSLHNTAVTDDGLAHLAGLTQLQALDLGHTRKVTNAGLKHLGGLKQLRWLCVDGTAITEAGLARLKKTLPNLKIAKPEVKE